MKSTNPACAKHFPGGWYITTSGDVLMAVPPHMGVDADHACPDCRGWLTYPDNFSHWRFGSSKPNVVLAVPSTRDRYLKSYGYYRRLHRSKAKRPVKVMRRRIQKGKVQ